MAVWIAVAIGFGFLTARRNEDYRSEFAIWADTVAKRPRNPRAQCSLGDALAREGRVQEAIASYRRALELKPNYAEAHNNLGTALAKAASLEEAIGHFEEALRTKPDYPEAHNNLGAALVRLGKVQEAVGHYERVLRLRPDYAEAHNNFGNALGQVGRVREAIAQYEQALRLQPDHAEAANNLAWLLATLAPAEGGDAVRAVTLAQRACQLTGDRSATSLDTLAVAYAATGRFAEAIATAQKAVELARAGGQPQLAKEIETRLELYRRGRAYRQSQTPLQGQSVDVSRPWTQLRQGSSND
jgi:Flp pilus assembly protein TadD